MRIKYKFKVGDYFLHPSYDNTYIGKIIGTYYRKGDEHEMSRGRKTVRVFRYKLICGRDKGTLAFWYDSPFYNSAKFIKKDDVLTEMI